MTRYIKIIPPNGQFDQIEWMPWLNCKPDDSTVEMAAMKFTRERGGIEPDREGITLMVYMYDENTPLYPNGRPKCCDGFKVRITNFQAGNRTH